MNQVIKNILADILYIGIFYILSNHTRFYIGFLNTKTHDVISLIAILFITFSILKNIIIKPKKNKRVFFFETLFELIITLKEKLVNTKKLTEGIGLTKDKKTVLLSFLVKMFYVPLMLNFCINNFQQVQDLQFNKSFFTFSNFIDFFNNNFFTAIIAIVFFIDTIVFTFGYLIESKYLKNEIKSVEPTLFGWLVCLMCYPPFNTVTGKYISWASNDHAFYWNENITFIFRILIILLLLIYLTATLNLGTKASNLTNRGIVKKGVYRIVRHPAYISKNIMWWITAIPILIIDPILILGLLAWSFIYFLRAITEERHLLQDKEYQQYCTEVKYRFIPKIF